MKLGELCPTVDLPLKLLPRQSLLSFITIGASWQLLSAQSFCPSDVK